MTNIYKVKLTGIERHHIEQNMNICRSVSRCCRDGHSSHQKDSKWAWMVCLAASTNMAFTAGLLFCFGVLLPVFMDYFNESRERTAWVGSLSFAFGLAVAPLGASLINRFGCRAVSMAGCLACASGLAVASFASSLTLLFVSYAVFGCGSGCVLVSSVVVVRRCFDKRQSLALGVSAAGQGLGTMVLSQVLQSLVTVVHWRDTLRIFAAALFLNSFCGILYDANLTQGHISSSSDEEEGRHRENSKSFTLHCSVWKVPGFLLLTACSFFFMFARITNYVHLVKFAQDLGTSFSAASRLVLYLGITAVVGRFAGGFLCSIKQLKNLYILQGAGLINGISMMLLTLAQSYSPLVAYAFTFGFCDGVTATVMNIEAVTCVDHYRAASSFGHFLLTISVTTLVGPPISGLIADSFGSYKPAFLMSGAFFIMGSLIPLVICFKRSNKRSMRDSLVDESEAGKILEQPGTLTESAHERRNSDINVHDCVSSV